jgi:uncharacterized protein YjbJ (UPF0337 family)
MNKDQIKGTLKNLTGKAQEETGKLVGSKVQQAKGVHKQVVGQGQQALGDAKEAVKDARDQAKALAGKA